MRPVRLTESHCDHRKAGFGFGLMNPPYGFQYVKDGLREGRRGRGWRIRAPKSPKMLLSCG
jgi:hypothetical protein